MGKEPETRALSSGKAIVEGLATIRAKTCGVEFHRRLYRSGLLKCLACGVILGDVV